MSNPDSINRSYRNGDINRWQQLDFVVGFEIKISNNPKYDCEVCKRLAGKYPKVFNWSGWHDGCHCFITPLLMDEETFDEQELSDLRAALRGTEYKKYTAKNEVKYVPESFIDWFLENRESFNRNNTMPEFIYGNINIIVQSYEHYKNKS